MWMRSSFLFLDEEFPQMRQVTPPPPPPPLSDGLLVVSSVPEVPDMIPPPITASLFGEKAAEPVPLQPIAPLLSPSAFELVIIGCVPAIIGFVPVNIGCDPLSIEM